MVKLPKGWRVYRSGDPNGELRRHKAFITQHSAAEAQRRRVQAVHRILRHSTLWSLILIALVALGWRMLNREPMLVPPHPSTWPTEIKAKHQAAASSCEAARAVGL